MAGKTFFDKKCDAAVALTKTVRVLENGAKLSAAAFYKDALRAGNCTDAAVTKFERALADVPGVDGCRGFINRLAREFSSPNFPRVPPVAKFGKILLCYGSAEVTGQLAAIGATLGQAIALAARVAVNRWPTGFGSVDDPDAHAAELAAAKARLDRMMEKLREQYAPKDLATDAESLTPEQKAAGLTRLSFKRVPSISPGNPDWPAALISHLIGHPEPVVIPAVTESEPGESEAAVLSAGGIRRAGARAATVL